MHIGLPRENTVSCVTYQEITCLYITLIQCYLQRYYIVAAVDTIYKKTKMQVFCFISKFFNSLALHCSSLHLPTSLQIFVLHILTPSHQKSIQHQSVLQHGHI